MATEETMPEKIWVEGPSWTVPPSYYYEQEEGCTPYVRADFHEAELVRLNRLVRLALAVCDNEVVDPKSELGIWMEEHRDEIQKGEDPL